MSGRFIPMPAITKGESAHRYEVKFVCAQTLLPTVRSWIRAHPAAFGHAYPPRRVNNIYFDSHAWGDLEEGVEGAADRRKLRLRWYGEQLSPIHGTLELKLKNGLVGRKWRCPVDSTINLTRMDWKTVLATLLHADLGPLTSAMANAGCPAIINYYHREYYVSADSLVRLTLDTSLVSYSQWLSPKPNLRRRLIRPEELVVELKANQCEAARVAAIACEFPLRPSSHSKYVKGVLGLM